MPPSGTKSGTRKLSDLARHVVLPDGIVSTGWPAVREKCLELGVRFDSWQDGLNRAILGKRADGKYAAGVGGVVLSIPRQVGKTFTVGTLVFALCILCPGLTVVWTAHRTRTAGETFRSMQGMARRSKVRPFVEQVFTGSGDEEVRFRNGSRILFGARERGFGRGFAEVDIEVFDEAQILTERALDDMIPATNQSKQPAGALLFFIGTPPKPTDPGEAFTAKRAKAIQGKSTDELYVEFSADKGADPDDRKQWAKANPSFPQRTPVEAMLRMRENLSDESFLREALGIWDDAVSGSVIPVTAWVAAEDAESGVVNRPVFALDVAPDRSWSAIAAAGMNAHGRRHIEVTSHDGGVLDHAEGTGWVVPRLRQMRAKFPFMRLYVAAGSGAKSLIPEIEALDIPVEVLPAQDVAAGCGLFFDLATAAPEPGLAHLGQDALTSALNSAKKRQENGETAWIWGRKRSTEDITPLYACTLALWAAHVAQTADYDVADSIF